MLLWLAVDSAAVLAAVLVVSLATRVAARLLVHRSLAVRLVHRARWPLQLLLASMVTASTVAAAEVSPTTVEHIEHGALVTTIGACAWLVAREVGVLVDEWIRTLRVDRSDNLRARTARTQLLILRRLATVVVAVIALAAIMWTFNEVRALSASLLASAGVISVVAGIAAQSSLANLFAGLQIAFTAPIRYDDVVVIDGEWGRVEDISLTNVVVRTWDERRLILPCTWFTQNIFENWTRPTSQLLAPVLLELDHRIDVDEIRAVVDDLVANHPLWDRRAKAVQVTDAGTTTLTVRVLLSARGASDAFDLRCDVREALFAHLREHRPETLPGLRLHGETRLTGAAARTAAGRDASAPEGGVIERMSR